ncbi:MAG TPA: OB-fold domain-containing protein, partial [Acidimicrobiales bacterium]|nr:OB-fold domain-containing protein [Acidimicrobiales bacterium]
SGRGTVYAASAQHVAAAPALADRVPYVVALVELEEGVRLMSNVVGCAADEVHAGMPVQVTWEALEDGRNLPQFEPVAGGTA